jgi:hypothetical protein
MSRYWPFDLRWALVASLVLVPALVAGVVVLFRPDGPLESRLTLAPLLIAVLLGLVPLFLVILDRVGSVEAAGIRVAFAAVQDVASTQGLVGARSLIAENLGSPPGAVTDTGSDTIIDSLRNAIGTYCVVVDLKEGEEWWETRLLVLASGASRLASPQAVVFTAASPGQPRRFLGWATPSELLRRLIAMEPALGEAYAAAQRDWLRWQLSEPPAPNGRRVLPWAPSGPYEEELQSGTRLPTGAKRKSDNRVEYPWPSAERVNLPWIRQEDGFVAERLLLNHLQPLEMPDKRRTVTETRAHELFSSVLHTDSVDSRDGEETWLETILGSGSDFFALTTGSQFVNLVPRMVALNAVLLAVISDQTGNARAMGSGTR